MKDSAKKKNVVHQNIKCQVNQKKINLGKMNYNVVKYQKKMIAQDPKSTKRRHQNKAKDRLL